MFAVILDDGEIQCIASKEYKTFEDAESFRKIAFKDNGNSRVVDINYY